MQVQQAIRWLKRSSCMHLTTFGDQGQSGTVPVWFFVRQGAIYFCSQAHTIKVRRIRRNPQVSIGLGERAQWVINCQARIVENAPNLQSFLIRAYRRRYPLRWLWLGRGIKKRLVRGDEVIIELTPDDPETQRLLLNLA